MVKKWLIIFILFCFTLYFFSYWQEIAKEIMTICGSLFALLSDHDWAKSQINKMNYHFKKLLAVSREAVTWKWLQENPSTKDNWPEIDNEVNCIEE